jgi:hypothetical protein
MMYLTIRKVAAITAFTCVASFSMAQDPGPKTKSAVIDKPSAKPFRILTSGQRITVQSNKNINNVIVWTASGNRFVEQTNIEAPSFNFFVPSKEKYVFMMLELQGGKRYTEKIGVQ